MLLKKLNEYKMLTAICGSAILYGLLAFSVNRIHELARQTMLKMNAIHHLEGSESKLKRYELLISDDGFFRYRKYLLNGHQEYYSFNMLRFNDLDYIGSTTIGTLVLRTQNDDVIVQTYHDSKGNVDSMTYQVDFPVKDIEAEDLLAIRENLFQIKRELQPK